MRTLDDLKGTDKDVRLTDGGGELHSVRILTREDGCGFSVTDVKFQGSRTMNLHYKNHVEANLIVAGSGKPREPFQQGEVDANSGHAICCRP